MFTTTRPHRSLTSLTTLLLGGTCTAGLTVLLAVGPQNAWSSVSSSGADQPTQHRQTRTVTITVERPCFMTPLNWPTAEVGPLPTCTQSRSSSFQPASVQKQRSPSSAGLVLYDAPCFMGHPSWTTADGPVPRCERLAVQ